MCDPNGFKNICCKNFKWNVREAVEQEEKLCDDVEAILEFTYLCDRVSTGGRCEASVSVRRRCGYI